MAKAAVMKIVDGRIDDAGDRLKDYATLYASEGTDCDYFMARACLDELKRLKLMKQQIEQAWKW